MKKEFRREQHYAVSKGGILTHIKDAHENADVYFCPYCRCHMLKKCGNIRAWHFAHDYRNANEFQKACSYETYLHGYAKLRLKQWFDESESIILHYPQTVSCKSYDYCKLKYEHGFVCAIDKMESYDLKKLFDNCIIEAPVKEANGNYRADLLLSSSVNSQNYLLLEINVTHGCTEKKKSSKARIIEFDICSEEDIEYIATHDIVESETIRYYGFKNQRKVDEEGVIKPALTLQKFFVYISGKAYLKTIDCQNVTNRHPSSLFELTAITSEENHGYLYCQGLLRAHERGLEVRNCILCKNSCYNKEKDCCECKIKGEKIEKRTDASDCIFYELKTTALDWIRMRSFPYKEIDMWVRATQK